MMKHITLIGLALLLSVSAQGQIIFTSGFEDWASGLPTDWYGAKTNLPQAGVEQVTTNVHEGANAVRLIKASTGHQRFTTQAQTVVANQAYEVRFWVRGEGQIRMGLYDGRATSSGYSPYTAYTTVTGNTWMEVALNVTAVMNATDAEFILSLQSTAAPEHLVVDHVTITEITVTPPPVVTIQDIQTTTAPDGSSPLANQLVQTSGVVTAITTTPSNGYFVQNGSGPWSGIFVFNAPGALVIGDDLTITGTVSEFNGQTQLSGLTNQVVNSSGNIIPNTAITTADALTEPFESVLATVSNAACTEIPGGANFGKWKADDGSGWVYIGKQMYTTTPAPLLGQHFNVTGVVIYSFGEFNLAPRQTSDVELVTSVNELSSANVSVFPNPVADALTLDLTGISSRTELRLNDVSGRLVMSDVLTAERSTMSVGHLADGMYTLTFINAGSNWSTRVVVRH